ncbi:MAG: pyridoxamine 5'-phosphate oxidase family protein [Nonomuraea sp.]|nr:pyridoxamine 5'-phosphate oxidase family protein [Nonomuraea sp.]
MDLPAARSAEQRKRDVLDRLERDVDLWVGTAADGGEPYLVPLSFLWTGTEIILSTEVASPTGRNLLQGGRVRLGVGLTRDVVLIEGVLHAAERVSEVAYGDAFAEKAGFDPRKSGDAYRYFVIRPERIQAWREVNELSGRDLMRKGEWLV